jgi:hypothetical protein
MTATNTGNGLPSSGRVKRPSDLISNSGDASSEERTLERTLASDRFVPLTGYNGRDALFDTTVV